MAGRAEEPFAERANQDRFLALAAIAWSCVDGDTAPTRRSRKPAPADGASPVFPPEACVVEIESPLVTALEGPSPDAAEAGRVPPGSYRVFESTMTSWAGKDFRWLRVSIPPREGWIEDSIINVASKSDACP